MSTEEYVARMTLNKELFARRIAEATITADERQAFAGAPLRLLAITEDFCGDSAQFLPPLARLAEELENVELRFLLRDAQRELASGYLRKDGYQAIPVIIALDAEGNELGFLIERPERVYQAFSDETRRFAGEHPELDGISRTYDRMPDATKQAVRANIDQFRASRQDAWTRWLFEDLAELVGRALASSRAQLDAAG